MNTIRTLAAAAVILTSSLGAHAAPVLEENGSAATPKSPKPEVAHTMIPSAKAQQVAYLCHYQWYCNAWGQCSMQTICNY